MRRDASAAPPGNLFEYSDRPGDVGPLWSSAIGGGEGSRGDDEGETGVVILCSAKEWYMSGLKSTAVCTRSIVIQQQAIVLSTQLSHVSLWECFGLMLGEAEQQLKRVAYRSSTSLLRPHLIHATLRPDFRRHFTPSRQTPNSSVTANAAEHGRCNSVKQGYSTSSTKLRPRSNEMILERQQASSQSKICPGEGNSLHPACTIQSRRHTTWLWH